MTQLQSMAVLTAVKVVMAGLIICAWKRMEERLAG